MWLVTAGDTQIADKVLTYKDGNEFKNMYWSSTYNAYAYLVIAETQDQVSIAAEMFGITNGTDKVDYDMNVNNSTEMDANDAQLVWNMYQGKRYTDFTEVSVLKFLEADVSDTRDTTGTEGLVDVNDATAIVAKILE